jgi:hypothetical protein
MDPRPRDPDPRIFSSRIPDPTFYVKKGVAKVNILFSCCSQFQDQVLRVAQFHKDNISPKKGAGSGIREKNSSRIHGVKSTGSQIRIRNTGSGSFYSLVVALVMVLK